VDQQDWLSTGTGRFMRYWAGRRGARSSPGSGCRRHGAMAVVSSRQPMNVRVGLAGRALTIRARADVVMTCGALPRS
jgi:hypothetical protein